MQRADRLLLAALGLPPDPRLADGLKRYARWWSRLIAALILILGVIW